MTREGIWESDFALPEFPHNLAQLLNRNVERFSDHTLYQEAFEGDYVPLTWNRFRTDIIAFQAVLAEKGLKQGDRVAILSQNRQEMLELELAVMAMGAITVPIFAGYPPQRADFLVRFCEPKMLVVADQSQYDKISQPESYSWIIHFDPVKDPGNKNLIPIAELRTGDRSGNRIDNQAIPADTVALMMYTSGTMGKPKCVQLTHGNILSQQSAMRVLWELSHQDRFLSYLPWHHSFGGIFEKYAAITNGAVLSLENGYGKNIDTLLDNWRKVRPTVFFSVPRVYQEIITQALQNPAIEKLIFHEDLRFIFTAAAPLPKNISDRFEERGIPVIEGWGLTETSPCCTVTDPGETREAGVVGKPIPGVSVRLAEDGEIMIKGPNVMQGYFKNPEATKAVLDSDGWFYTGDVGEFTSSGLRLISRKDRIFKLTNAEKVIPTEIENMITKDCTFLTHAYVSGSGRDYPVVLLFPNRAMFSQIPDDSNLKKGCECPNGVEDFADCLKNCLQTLNQSLGRKFSRLKAAMLLDYELTIENEELTPSMKLAPNVVGKVFKANLEHLYSPEEPLQEKVYIINLEV